jgi:GH25 family lysozyme M1 (1,4-beta-N-acetylmuramidase)
MNAYFATTNDETNVANLINLDRYDVEVNGNKPNNKHNKHNKNNKFKKFSDEIEAIKNNKIHLYRERDSRYSFKNRRIVNKDWKDFNNNQM